jgi:hypothetical protein
VSMERGTGGNRFIDADAGIPELMRVIHEGLYELAEYDADRPLDIAEVTITTKRIPSGRISVEVAADLTTPAPLSPPAATSETRGGA